MINLHSIHNTFVFSDMLLANIWECRKDMVGDYFIRINLLRIDNPNLEDYFSPIDYGIKDKWIDKWYWEPQRLAQWIDAGRPFVDISNIEIGTWEI